MGAKSYLATCRTRVLRRRSSLIICALAAVVSPSYASPTFSEDSIKAAYLYRFTQYIDWPQPATAGEPFTIAVLGAPGVARELQRLLPDHPIKNSAARVKVVTRVQDMEAAQMLYVGPQPPDGLRNVISSIAALSVLLVTDDEEGLEAGSMLNFITADHRVRFEVSLVATDRKKFRVSSELLGVAARVRGTSRQSDAAHAEARKPPNE